MTEDQKELFKAGAKVLAIVDVLEKQVPATPANEIKIFTIKATMAVAMMKILAASKATS